MNEGSYSKYLLVYVSSGQSIFREAGSLSLLNRDAVRIEWPHFLGGRALRRGFVGIRPHRGAADRCLGCCGAATQPAGAPLLPPEQPFVGRRYQP